MPRPSHTPSPTIALGALVCVVVVAGSAGCPLPEDNLEPNDSAGDATHLVLGAPAVAAIIALGDEDFFTAGEDGDAERGDVVIRFLLRQTGAEKAARLAIPDPADANVIGDDVQVCDAEDAPLPRVTCDGTTVVAELVQAAGGDDPVVVVRQPSLCVECFNGEESAYEIAASSTPAP